MTPPAEICPANAETWAAFEKLVTALVLRVRYGPGRGLWDGGRFLVTYAPGRRSQPSDLRAWTNTAGELYPSLHCTSLCNLVLGWLTRRNQDYTHAGNIPELADLLAAPPTPRFQSGVGTWGGYGDVCYEMQSNGSTAGRVRSLIHGKPYIDAVEIYERRALLPTFCVFAQSTKQADGNWWTWHHTGLFCFRDGRMFRLAADGFHGAAGYSATPVHWTEITPANISTLDLCRYRLWGVATLDGSYGPQDRAIAPVEFE